MRYGDRTILLSVVVVLALLLAAVVHLGRSTSARSTFVATAAAAVVVDWNALTPSGVKALCDSGGGDPEHCGYNPKLCVADAATQREICLVPGANGRSLEVSLDGRRVGQMSTRPLVRYVKLVAAKQDCMNVGELRVYDDQNKDLASGRPVSMSSGYQGNMFPGANLVDGNPGTFAHTSCYDRGWMMVDLGAPGFPVAKTTVVNRQDCCQWRLAGTVVEHYDHEGKLVARSLPLDGAATQTL